MSPLLGVALVVILLDVVFVLVTMAPRDRSDQTTPEKEGASGEPSSKDPS